MTAKKTAAELLQERENYPFGKPRPYTPDHPNLLTDTLHAPRVDQVRLLSNKARLILVLMAIAMAAYGLHGVLSDDLYFPAKRSAGTHYHGFCAWLMFGMITSVAGALITVAFCRFDVACRSITHKKPLIFLSISALLCMLAAIASTAATGG